VVGATKRRPLAFCVLRLATSGAQCAAAKVQRAGEQIGARSKQGKQVRGHNALRPQLRCTAASKAGTLQTSLPAAVSLLQCAGRTAAPSESKRSSIMAEETQRAAAWPPFVPGRPPVARRDR